MKNHDVDAVLIFLRSAAKDIDFIIKKLVVFEIKQKKLYDLLEGAWEEAIVNAKNAIKYVEERKDDKEFHENLKVRGLTGLQMEFKLATYEIVRGEFYGAVERDKKLPPNIKQRKRGWGRNIIRKRAAKCLSIIDRILDSLVFVPAVEAIKEIKGIVEDLL